MASLNCTILIIPYMTIKALKYILEISNFYCLISSDYFY